MLLRGGRRLQYEGGRGSALFMWRLSGALTVVKKPERGPGSFHREYHSLRTTKMAQPTKAAVATRPPAAPIAQKRDLRKELKALYRRPRALQLSSTSRRCNFVCGAVHHHQKPVGLDGGLVTEDAVLRNSDAVQRRAQSTQSTNYDCSLDSRDRSSREVSQSNHRPEQRGRDEQSAEEQCPERTPEGAA